MKKISTKFLPVTGGTITDIKVQLYYTDGGLGGKKGLYLSVSPVKREVTNGIIIESYGAYTGVKELVLPMARYNEKKAFSFSIPADLESKMLDYVCNKNGLTLC